MNKKAKFHIPGLDILYPILCLLKLQKEYPFCFYDDVEITEIYGAFAGCLWNGRTPLFYKPFLPIQKIGQIKNIIENAGLSLNLTWNNNMLKPEDFNDKYCNIITELFHNNKHSITVASNDLFLYLKEKYPNYAYYKSIINTDIDDKINYDYNYKIQLMPRKFNNNWDVLKTIPKENRQHYEFLCNDNCSPTCDRQKHYDIVNYCFSNFAEESCIFNNNCPINHNFSFYNTRNWPITIKPEDIKGYLKEGYMHFKLSGREEKQEILLYKICKYIIKPEYFDDIFFNILEDKNENSN